MKPRHPIINPDKMKITQSFLKMMIRMLILLILLVCLYLLSAFLYSARYWPDIYNYVNANITIERIPTISELNIQIVEVGYDGVTEGYSTTDADYFELSTIDDFDLEDFMTAGFDVKTKVKRDVMIEEMKDYKELPNRPIFVDYVFLEVPFEIDNKMDVMDDEKDILRIGITKEVVDNQGTKALKANINDKTITETINDVENPDNHILKSIHNKENKGKYTEEFKAEVSTTKEGYLIGDEVDQETEHQPAKELPHITTERYENDFDEEPGQLLKDSVDVSKLSTRGPEDVEMLAGMEDGLQEMTIKSAVFPWVATIFIKNSTDSSQFHYYCDGALISEKVVLTGGRCLYQSGSIVAPENVLVFLGKANLQAVGGNEKLHRVKSVVLHQNFSLDFEGRAENDLAMIILDESAVLDDRIQSACIHLDESAEVQDAATTAWGPNGQLQPIYFEKQKSDICFDKSEDIFCTTYGSNVPLCPNFGGIYATKRSSKWCLQGIFYGDPSYRGLCFNKNVLFTSLRNYHDWIDDYIIINANIL